MIGHAFSRGSRKSRSKDVDCIKAVLAERCKQSMPPLGYPQRGGSFSSAAGSPAARSSSSMQLVVASPMGPDGGEEGDGSEETDKEDDEEEEEEDAEEAEETE
eukprot:7669992-Alexandrium_andersonii.AAC.1